MGRKQPDPYYLATTPFVCDGKKQFVEVADSRQTVRRRRWRSKELIEETICPITRAGCYIEEIAASPSGAWLVTQRISGAGEWGYDVFRTCPLARTAGVAQEGGYILELPKFAKDESFLIGGAGEGFLGGWWAHPDDDIDEPSRGGVVSLGFLFVHRLPSHRVSRHNLRVKPPKGWLPEDRSRSGTGRARSHPPRQGCGSRLPGACQLRLRPRSRASSGSRHRIHRAQGCCEPTESKRTESKGQDSFMVAVSAPSEPRSAVR